MRISHPILSSIAVLTFITSMSCSRSAQFSAASSLKVPEVKSYTKEFTAASWDSHQVDHTMTAESREELVIQGGGPIEEHFTQRESALHTESFSLPIATDELVATQPQVAKLDILIVVDNSSSMLEEQTNLSQKLQPLLSYVKDVNWQIGVVTTDVVDGCLRSLIKPTDAGYEAKFASAIKAGTAGSYVERGILQAKRSLAGCRGQAPWIREGSSVAILFVSDEDNCSRGGLRCDQAIPTGTDIPQADFLASATAAYLTDYLGSIRTLKTKARIYGLISNPTQPLCTTATNRGEVYTQAITITAGAQGSICDNDYTKTLESVSKDMRELIASEFKLPHAPLDGSVSVFIDGTQQTGGFTVQGTSVTLQKLPTFGSTVKIDYSYATATSASFKLATAPADGSLSLELDGKKLTDSAFNFDGASQTIHLTALPIGKALVASYRAAGDLDGTFTLKMAPDETTIAITVADKSVAADQFSFDATSSQIKLNQIPADGMVIAIKYLPKSALQATFPLKITEEQRISLTVTDKATGEAIPFTADGETIAFTEESIKEGRSLVISYAASGVETNTIDLSRDIMSFDELTVTAAAGETCAREKITTEGTKINIAGCGFKDGEKVTITHKYIASFNKSFLLDDEGLKSAGQVALKITVNGVETEDYTFDKETDTLTMGELNIADVVGVEATYY